MLLRQGQDSSHKKNRHSSVLKHKNVPRQIRNSNVCDCVCVCVRGPNLECRVSNTSAWAPLPAPVPTGSSASPRSARPSSGGQKRLGSYQGANRRGGIVPWPMVSGYIMIFNIYGCSICFVILWVGTSFQRSSPLPLALATNCVTQLKILSNVKPIRAIICQHQYDELFCHSIDRIIQVGPRLRSCFSSFASDLGKKPPGDRWL